MADVFTIEGKIRRNDYQFKIRPKLSAMNFSDAMQRNRKVFKSKFLENETVAISVWTTPKRTKTYPFARVYDTLSYDGIKITIIPAMVDYGKHGERGKIQPSTVDWMTSIGVYLILGIYVHAEKGKKGKMAANAGSKTQSSEGKPKFAQGQKFDTDYLQKQIQTIIMTKPDVKEWNERQLEMIPEFLEKGIEIYKKLGEKLDVPLGNFAKMEYDVRRWRKDSKQFLKDCEEASKGAQNRETVSDHVLEDVPGNKGKINIDFGESRKLYLTSDSMELEKGTVKLLEGKNTSSEKYPVMGDVKDALVKLMIFRSSDFEFEGEDLEKKLVCYLTGKHKDVEDDLQKITDENEFRDNCKSLIDECSANDIELVLNRRIIK